MGISRLSRFAGLPFLLALLLFFSVYLAARAQTADPLEQGARLYAENCAVCHGPNGEGRIGATLSKDWPSIRPDLTVKTIISNGVPGSPMSAWSQTNGGPLSEAEIDAIVAFILSWQTGSPPQMTAGPTATRRPPITPLPQVHGDPNRGALLFDQNCAMCHGAYGEGRIGAALAKAWPGIRPDLGVKTTISNGIQGSPMPAWSQANGGPLSESEIDDLTAYILALGESGAVVQVSPTVIAPSTGPSQLAGWAGVAVFIVILFAIVAIAIFLQRRTSNP
jgi:mono/diheme cytochrome c family protein